MLWMDIPEMMIFWELLIGFNGVSCDLMGFYVCDLSYIIYNFDLMGFTGTCSTP